MIPAEHRFPCGQCGASLTFRPGQQELVCDWCGHRQTIGPGPARAPGRKADDSSADPALQWSEGPRAPGPALREIPLAEGLDLCGQLCQAFWDEVHPQPDPDRGPGALLRRVNGANPPRPASGALNVNGGQRLERTHYPRVVFFQFVDDGFKLIRAVGVNGQHVLSLLEGRLRGLGVAGVIGPKCDQPPCH